MRQSCAPGTILAMLRTVETRYGDVLRYLSVHGFTPDQVERLRHRLRVG
jgi:hypothetical protein